MFGKDHHGQKSLTDQPMYIIIYLQSLWGLVSNLCMISHNNILFCNRNGSPPGVKVEEIAESEPTIDIGQDLSSIATTQNTATQDTATTQNTATTTVS